MGLNSIAQREITGFFGVMVIQNFEENIPGVGIEMGVINLENTLGFGLDISRIPAEDYNITMAHMNILCKVKKNFIVPLSFGAESKSNDDITPSIGFGGIYLPENPKIYLGLRGYLSFIEVPNNEVSFSNISVQIGFKF